MRLGKAGPNPTKKPCVIPEKIIQAQVESYLRARRIPYLRLPDGLYRSLGRMTKRDGIDSAKAISGYPDLSIFKVLPDGSTKVLPLELKSAKGKMSPTQEMWAQKIGTKLARSVEEAVALIQEFWDK